MGQPPAFVGRKGIAGFSNRARNDEAMVGKYSAREHSLTLSRSVQHKTQL